MKRADEIIVIVMYGLFGALLAFLVFTFGLGGWAYVFTGKPRSVLIGFPGLLLFLTTGASLGLLSYRHRHREFGGVGPLAHDAATGYLLAKRVIVILTCLAGVYFVWQLAKDVR